jgi:hypothetical protein
MLADAACGKKEQNVQLNDQQVLPESEEDEYIKMQMQQIYDEQYANHDDENQEEYNRACCESLDANYYVNPYQSKFIPNQENDEELNRALAESEKYYQKELTLKKAEEKIQKNNSNEENSIRTPNLKSPEKQRSSKTSTKALEKFYKENYAKNKQSVEQQHEKEFDAFNEIRSQESNANFDYLNGREVQVKEFFNVQQEKYKRYKQDNAKTTQSETNGSDKNERYEY